MWRSVGERMEKTVNRALMQTIAFSLAAIAAVLRGCARGEVLLREPAA